MPVLGRRAVVLGPLGVAGCAAPFVQGVVGPEAKELLRAGAQAHGLEALPAAVTVRYAGEWRPLVGRLQPALIDPGFRGGSTERLRPADGVVDQVHTGPQGTKRVERRWANGSVGTVRVWFNGTEAGDADQRGAAALVADGYALFLLGPMLLMGAWRPRWSHAALAPPERIEVHGTRLDCDVVRVALSPGLGLSAEDQLAVYLDREKRLMRRVRFSLDGLAGTKGAVAEVDLYGHVARYGVQWPVGFYERLLRPAPLPVHDWRLVELEV